MKSIISLGLLVLALTFCGIGDRLKDLGSSNSGGGSNSGTDSKKSGDASVERPTLSGAQQEIQNNSTETKWDEQGISWKLPGGWPKMSGNKDSINFGTPAKGFLIASISVMPDSFPADISINATYDQALEQLKQGNYERVRWLEIDGVKGVEWAEAMKEKDGIRRHQWIGFRKYLGQNQQVNIIISTNGENFDKQEDTFKAIMYSMKIPNS